MGHTITRLAAGALLLLLAYAGAFAEDATIHIHGTRGAHVWIDGKSLGTPPVLGLRLSEGPHELSMKKPGFEGENRKLWLNPTRVVTDVIYLHQKRRRDAAWRALILPGWGTHYNENRIRGAFYAAAEAGFLLFAVWENGRFEDRLRLYEDADTAYREAVTDGEIERKGALREEAYDDMKLCESHRDDALLGAVLVYGVSLLDAFVLFPFGDDPPPGRVALHPVWRAETNRTDIALRILF